MNQREKIFNFLKIVVVTYYVFAGIMHDLNNTLRALEIILK